MDPCALTSLDSPVAKTLSELLDGWSPQHFPAERMIIIVPDFSAGVVNFIFSGRNSGQLPGLPILNGDIAQVLTRRGDSKGSVPDC